MDRKLTRHLFHLHAGTREVNHSRRRWGVGIYHDVTGNTQRLELLLFGFTGQDNLNLIVTNTFNNNFRRLCTTAGGNLIHEQTFLTPQTPKENHSILWAVALGETLSTLWNAVCVKFSVTWAFSWIWHMFTLSTLFLCVKNLCVHLITLSLPASHPWLLHPCLHTVHCSVNPNGATQNESWHLPEHTASDA